MYHKIVSILQRCVKVIRVKSSSTRYCWWNDMMKIMICNRYLWLPQLGIWPSHTENNPYTGHVLPKTILPRTTRAPDNSCPVRWDNPYQSLQGQSSTHNFKSVNEWRRKGWWVIHLYKWSACHPPALMNLLLQFEQSCENRVRVSVVYVSTFANTVLPTTPFLYTHLYKK